MSTPSYSYPAPKEASGTTTQPGSWLSVVKHQVETLRFGAVTVTVHEGRVVQVETSSKVRFDRAT